MDEIQVKRCANHFFKPWDNNTNTFSRQTHLMSTEHFRSLALPPAGRREKYCCVSLWEGST